MQPSGCFVLYATMSPLSSASQKPQFAAAGLEVRSAGLEVRADSVGGADGIAAARDLVPAAADRDEDAGRDDEARQQDGDGCGDDQFDVGVALATSAHGRSCS